MKKAKLKIEGYVSRDGKAVDQDEIIDHAMTACYLLEDVLGQLGYTFGFFVSLSEGGKP